MKLPAMKWAWYWSLTERFGKIESAKMHNMYPRESNIRDYNLFANSLAGEPSKHLSPEFQAIENTSPTFCNYCPLYYIYYVRWCSGPTYYANQNKNHPDFKVRPSSLNKKRYPSLFVVCFSLTTRHGGVVSSVFFGDNLRLRLHEFLMDLAEMLGKSKGGGSL